MAWTISIGIPAINPSVSMWVYRKVSQNGSNARIMSKAVTAVGVRQPSIVTLPPRESSANISAVLGTVSARARACSWLDPAFGQQRGPDDDLARTQVQKFLCGFKVANATANLAFSWPTISLTNDRLSPAPRAASRSMSWTIGYLEKRSIQ